MNNACKNYFQYPLGNWWLMGVISQVEELWPTIYDLRFSELLVGIAHWGELNHKGKKGERFEHLLLRGEQTWTIMAKRTWTSLYCQWKVYSSCVGKRFEHLIVLAKWTWMWTPKQTCWMSLHCWWEVYNNCVCGSFPSVQQEFCKNVEVL